MASGLDPAEIKQLETVLASMVDEIKSISGSMQEVAENMKATAKDGKEAERTLSAIEKDMKNITGSAKERLDIEKAVRRELLKELGITEKVKDKEGKLTKNDNLRYKIMVSSRKEMLTQLKLVDKRRGKLEKERKLMVDARELMKKSPVSAIGKMAEMAGVSGLGKIGETVGKFKEAKKTGGAMVEAGGAMGGVGGGIMGMVGKAGPYGMIIAAVIQGLKSLFDIFDQANKKMMELRKSIYDDVGAFDSLRFSISGSDVSMRNVKRQFDAYTTAIRDTRVNLSEMMTIEERLGTMGGFKQAGTKITEVVSEITRLHTNMAGKVKGSWQELSEKDPTLIVRRRALVLGKSTEEMGKDFADWSYSTGISLLRVNKLFDQVTKYAVRSGLATNQFLSEIQAVSANMGTFQLQILGAAEELDKLSKIKMLTPEEAKAGAKGFASLFKNMGTMALPVFLKAIESPQVAAILKMQEEKAKRAVTQAEAAVEEAKKVAKKTGEGENLRKAVSELEKTRLELSQISAVADPHADSLLRFKQLDKIGAKLTELLAITGLTSMGMVDFKKGQTDGNELYSYAQSELLDQLKTDEATAYAMLGILRESESQGEYLGKQTQEMEDSLLGASKEQQDIFRKSLDDLARTLQPEIESPAKMLKIIKDGIMFEIWSVMDQLFRAFMGLVRSIAKSWFMRNTGLDKFLSAQKEGYEKRGETVVSLMKGRMEELAPGINQSRELGKWKTGAYGGIQEKLKAKELTKEQASAEFKKVEALVAVAEKKLLPISQKYAQQSRALEAQVDAYRELTSSQEWAEMDNAEQEKRTRSMEEAWKAFADKAVTAEEKTVITNVNATFSGDNLWALMRQISDLSKRQAAKDVRQEGKSKVG